MSTISNKEYTVYTNYVEMVTHECITCGIMYAMPKFFDDRCHRDQRAFYCPNGHSQMYSKSKSDILEEKLAAEKKLREAERATLQADVNWWRDSWEKQLNEKKKVTRKLKATEKRMANGTCPCCSRTVSQLQRHMETEHPDYVKQNLNKPLLKSKT